MSSQQCARGFRQLLQLWPLSRGNWILYDFVVWIYNLCDVRLLITTAPPVMAGGLYYWGLTSFHANVMEKLPKLSMISNNDGPLSLSGGHSGLGTTLERIAREAISRIQGIRGRSNEARGIYIYNAKEGFIGLGIIFEKRRINFSSQNKQQILPPHCQQTPIFRIWAPAATLMRTKEKQTRCRISRN